MRGNLLNFASALSLVLLLVAAAGWVRSQFVCDFVDYDPRLGTRSWTTLWVKTYTGYVSLTATRYEFLSSERDAFLARVPGVYQGRPVLAWSAKRYRGPLYNDAVWSERWTWNFGLPRTRFYRDPRRRMWDIEPVIFTRRTVNVPFWLVALVFSVVPLAWVHRAGRRRRRVRHGLCQHCGYDLRGSPGRCPECGSVATPESAHDEKQQGGPVADAG